ncbi:MAG: DUF896 domain-containing protein [Lachnospiraceae bacterium]|nr:DUF896 domain-containing protein [Lachnospiraceae bacterium]
MDEKTLEQRIARINALYHKSQKEGLTEEEKAEQAALRQEYVANVRANLRGQLDSITIQKEDGTLENLGEKYGGKNAPSKGSVSAGPEES